MSDLIYYLLCGLLVVGILVGISLMSKVKTAVKGNQLSAICIGLAVFLTLFKYEIFSQVTLWIFLIIGLLIGFIASYRVKMIQMPQVVALLNGFGGAASAIVAMIAIADGNDLSLFGLLTGGISLVIGTLTLTGSLIASGKLHQILNQKPVIFKRHQLLTTTLIILNIGANLFLLH